MTNADATPLATEFVSHELSSKDKKDLETVKRIAEFMIRLDNKQRKTDLEMTAEVSDDDYRDDVMV